MQEVVLPLVRPIAVQAVAAWRGKTVASPGVEAVLIMEQEGLHWKTEFECQQKDLGPREGWLLMILSAAQRPTSGQGKLPAEQHHGKTDLGFRGRSSPE